jgi:replication-associated recombination protein RarA
VFTFEPSTEASQLLTDIYRPRRVSDFIGLDSVKRLASKLIAKPFSSYYIFRGPSGMGKTTFSLALANEMGAELHHIPSQDCTVDVIERVHRACFYMPSQGKRCHMILIDEADLMTKASRDCLLSMMDGTRPAPLTIIVMTCNEVEKFEDRFQSRCMTFNFSSQGVSKPIAELLANIWTIEAPADAELPDFARITQDSKNNVRLALMKLQQKIICA